MRKRLCKEHLSRSGESLCVGSDQEISRVPCNVQPCPGAGMRQTITLVAPHMHVCMSFID